MHPIVFYAKANSYDNPARDYAMNVAHNEGNC